MISLVVPTRNRAAILRRVVPSFFAQAGVDEVVFVDDAGTDDTAAVLTEIAAGHPDSRLLILRNDERRGASESRNLGARAARNELILFCDDDEMLEPGYAATCRAKLESYRAAAISGRRIYMQVGETPDTALRRFGTGLRRSPPFRPLLCEYVNGARFEGDLELPFTNAVILTRKSLLTQYPFDAFYARGNGYREETDYQMNLFVNGHKIMVTNDCHSFHLPLAQVRSGGQRTARLKRIYWSIYYTRYFFRKYHRAYAARLGLKAPRLLALGAFAGFSVYRELVRPLIYPLALAAAARVDQAQRGARAGIAR